MLYKYRSFEAYKKNIKYEGNGNGLALCTIKARNRSTIFIRSVYVNRLLLKIVKDDTYGLFNSTYYLVSY